MTQAFPGNSARRSKSGMTGWVIFVALAVMMIALFSSHRIYHQPISFAHFRSLLDEKKISELSLSADQITGVMKTPSGENAAFSTEIPAGNPPNQQFIDSLKTQSGSAVVTINSNSSDAIGLLVSLLPWLVIVAFLWFFIIFRKAGKRHSRSSAESPANDLNGSEARE